MKKLYFLNEEEKQRILNMHKQSTKQKYLVESKSNVYETKNQLDEKFNWKKFFNPFGSEPWFLPPSPGKAPVSTSKTLRFIPSLTKLGLIGGKKNLRKEINKLFKTSLGDDEKFTLVRVNPDSKINTENIEKSRINQLRTLSKIPQEWNNELQDELNNLLKKYYKTVEFFKVDPNTKHIDVNAVPIYAIFDENNPMYKSLLKNTNYVYSKDPNTAKPIVNEPTKEKSRVYDFVYVVDDTDAITSAELDDIIDKKYKDQNLNDKERLILQNLKTNKYILNTNDLMEVEVNGRNTKVVTKEPKTMTDLEYIMNRASPKGIRNSTAVRLFLGRNTFGRYAAAAEIIFARFPVANFYFSGFIYPLGRFLLPSAVDVYEKYLTEPLYKVLSGGAKPAREMDDALVNFCSAKLNIAQQTINTIEGGIKQLLAWWTNSQVASECNLLNNLLNNINNKVEFDKIVNTITLDNIGKELCGCDRIFYKIASKEVTLFGMSANILYSRSKTITLYNKMLNITNDDYVNKQNKENIEKYLKSIITFETESNKFRQPKAPYRNFTLTGKQVLDFAKCGNCTQKPDLWNQIITATPVFVGECCADNSLIPLEYSFIYFKVTDQLAIFNGKTFELDTPALVDKFSEYKQEVSKYKAGAGGDWGAHKTRLGSLLTDIQDIVSGKPIEQKMKEADKKLNSEASDDDSAADL